MEIAERRPNDNALKLLFGMNQKLLETHWMLPRLQELWGVLQSIDCKSDPIECAKVFWDEVEVNFLSGKPRFTLGGYRQLNAALQVAEALYENEDRRRESAYHEKDHQLFEKILNGYIPGKGKASANLKKIRALYSKKRKRDEKPADSEITLSKADNEWLRESGLGQFLVDRKSLIITALDAVQDRVERWNSGPKAIELRLRS